MLGATPQPRTEWNPMPRYFFDSEGERHERDDDGIELCNRLAVPEAAVRSLLDLANLEVIKHGDREVAVTVRDDCGTLIYHASISLRAGWLGKSIE